MVLVHSSIYNKLMYKHGQACRGVRNGRVLIKTCINRQLLGPGSYRGVGSTNKRISTVCLLRTTTGLVVTKHLFFNTNYVLWQ